MEGGRASVWQAAIPAGWYLKMSENENRGRVVHCKKDSFDVYIGRPSKWGNPFKVDKGDPESRMVAVAKYEEWVKKQPELMAALPELKCKTLGCWCHPFKCHGEVLVRLANESEVVTVLEKPEALEWFEIELIRDTGAQQEALEKMLKEDPTP